MSKDSNNLLEQGSLMSRRRGKLLYSILAILLVVGLLPLIISSFVQIKKSEENIKLTVQEQQLATAVSLAEEIQLYLDLSTQKVAQIAETISFNATTSGFSATMSRITDTKYLRNYLEDDILYLQLTGLDGKGQAQSRIALDDEPLVVEELMRALSVSRNGEFFWGSPILLNSGSRAEAVEVMAFPVKVKGKTEGLLFGIISLDNVLDTIEERADSRGFTVYAIDANNVLFAHSDRAQVLMPFNYLENPLCREFKDSGGLSLTREFTMVENGKATKVLGACAALPERRWGVFVQLENSKAYKMVSDMKKSSLISTIIAAFLAVVTGLIFAQQVTKPLRLLTEGTESIARGDFSKKVHIKTTNEVGQLADTFNKMTTDIESFISRINREKETNRELFEGSIKSIAAAVDAKDPYTQGHSDRVTAYSVAIAKSMGLSAEEIKNVRLAAMLHDVGKIGVSDSVLGKKGALTDEEFEEMKKHPEKGAQIMAPITALRAVIPGLKYHHERYGGGGYPEGIAGEEIPLMARIISVADTFDAMTTKRPYQNPMTPDFAVSKIYELRKSKYDEKVVEAFMAAYRRGLIKLL